MASTMEVQTTDASDAIEEVTSQEFATSEETAIVSTELPNAVQGWQLTMVIVLILIAVVTFLGNSLVIASFIVVKKLRTKFNLFILNLAITDIMVSLTTTFYAIDLLHGYWPFNEALCGVWIFFDWGMTFLSIFTLVAISIDRYWAACFSVHYRNHNTWRKSIIFVALAWLTMLLLWVAPFTLDRIRWSRPHSCVWAVANNREFVLFVAIAGYHGPSVLMIICYIQVYRAMRKAHLAVGVDNSAKKRYVSQPTTVFVINNMSKTDPTKSQNNPDGSKPDGGSSNVLIKTDHLSHGPGGSSSCHMSSSNAANDSQSRSIPANKTQKKNSLDKEKRIFISLTYILACYLVCWTPFHVVFDILYINESLVSTQAYALGCIFCYLNSTLNPFIYAFSNKDFRDAFKIVLTLKF